MAVHDEGERNAVQKLAGRMGGILGLENLRKDDDEFISPHPRKRVALSYVRHEAIRDILQEPVAHGVAVHIIHCLEVIQVEEENCSQMPATARMGYCLAEPVIEK